MRSKQQQHQSEQEEITIRAYQLWEQAGHPEGCSDRFWLQAEAELKNKLTPKSKILVDRRAKCSALSV